MKKRMFSIKKVLSSTVASVMLALTLTSNMTMNATALNNAQSYKVFNATNGTFLQTYTLQQNPIQDNSRTVIGSDDRVVDFTKSGVVKIVLSNGDIGTGFIVDSHTIATAAHCVYNRDYNNVSNSYPCSISNIYVFNADGTVALNITNPSKYHIPTIFTTNATNASIYDYAMITVPQDLSDYAMFNLGAPLDNFTNSGKSVSITGFPGEVGSVSVNTPSMHNMYTSSGVTCSDVVDSSLEIAYTCDSSGGNSGGPVYTITSYGGVTYYTVVGVHAKSAGSANRAVRMTTNLLHFYKNNPNITY